VKVSVEPRPARAVLPSPQSSEKSPPVCCKHRRTPSAHTGVYSHIPRSY
jgi:hypothetical protein